MNTDSNGVGGVLISIRRKKTRQRPNTKKERNKGLKGKAKQRKMTTCSSSTSEDGVALESASNSSAFANTWINEDQRPVTYMVHPIIGEDRLLDTLKRRRATFATIKKAMNDLRKIKGQADFILSPADWCWVATGETWSQIRLTDDSTTTLVESDISLATNPLHRCKGTTNIASTLLGTLDDGASGDVGECSCHGHSTCSAHGKNETSLISGGSSSSNDTSVLSSENANSDHQRRNSGMRKFLRRVSKIFRRRSDLSASATETK